MSFLVWIGQSRPTFCNFVGGQFRTSVVIGIQTVWLIFKRKRIAVVVAFILCYHEYAFTFLEIFLDFVVAQSTLGASSWCGVVLFHQRFVGELIQVQSAAVHVVPAKIRGSTVSFDIDLLADSLCRRLLFFCDLNILDVKDLQGL